MIIGASATLGARFGSYVPVYGYMTGSAYWDLDLLMVQDYTIYTIADGGENRQSI
jgi:hypothetical protein